MPTPLAPALSAPVPAVLRVALLERVLDAAYALRGLPYRGTARYCPSCSRSARAFLPFRGRAESRCPHCGAFERHRLVSLYLERCTDALVAPLRILHIAPEYGIQRRLRRSRPTRDYVSLDAGSLLAQHRGTVVALPFDDASFDAVLCSHVLEHVDDDRQAMAEFHRVLRPGGWALLPVPIDWQRETTYEDASITEPARRAETFGQWDHVRLYGRDYADRLAGAGFEVDIDAFASTLDITVVTRCGLDAAERVVRVHKRPAAAVA